MKYGVEANGATQLQGFLHFMWSSVILTLNGLWRAYNAYCISESKCSKINVRKCNCYSPNSQNECGKAVSLQGLGS